MSLTSDFVDQTERKILKGEWKIGETIPPLRSLAEEFNVSRSVVNAAIVELQNKGYLKTVPRKRTVVADWTKEGTLAVMDGLFKNGLMSSEYVADILDGRRTVELAAVKDASKNRNDADLAELKNIIDKEYSDCTVGQRVNLDVAFHHAIAKASHNFVYSIVLKSFEKVVVSLVSKFYENNFDREYVYSTHEKIYDAIKSQNAIDAEKHLAELLSQGEYIVKTTMCKEE